MPPNEITKAAKRNPETARWKKGTSGNPAGRPIGSRNKSTLFFAGLFEDNLESVGEKLKELILSGHFGAMKLFLDRQCPRPEKGRVHLPLPKITGIEDAAAASAIILEAAANSEITIDEAKGMSQLVNLARITYQQYKAEANGGNPGLTLMDTEYDEMDV